MTDFQTFRAFVVDYLKDADVVREVDWNEVGDDCDLIEAGLVDSHAFIDLCFAIEEKTGHQVDIANLDSDQFSTIRALHKLVSRNEQ